MPGEGQGPKELTFSLQAYKTFNRLQSIVYPVAHTSNENMLVCAPTGAVSMLFPVTLARSRKLTGA